MGNTSSRFTERLKEWIPGFSGYAQLEKRREDDRLTRDYLAKRLQECKSQIEAMARPWVNAGKLEAVHEAEGIRHEIERQQSRVRSAVEGYASWFDSRKVDVPLLEKIAEMDSDMIGLVDRIQESLGNRPADLPDWKGVRELLELLSQRIDRRKSTLEEAQ